MSKKELPDVVYIPIGEGDNRLLIDTLGMVNDVLTAKGISLYFFIIESQIDNSIVTWREE